MADFDIDTEILEAYGRAQAMAEDWVRNATTLPELENYDWVPFFAALAVHGKKIQSLPLEEMPDSVYFDDFIHRDSGTLPLGKGPVKDPNSGSWTWVYYAPSWTHPNYSDNITVEYDGTRYLRGTVDPMTKIRPAMLASDALKNPTPYAKRFGIHPDETGGRSHLSPTTSNTRNPLEDYVTQISLLSDQEKSQALAETRRRGLSNPTDRNWIDPEVLREIFARGNIPTGSTLKASIANELRRDELAREVKMSSLDEIVDRLQTQHPDTFNANKNFLEGALRDQAWQRYLFGGLTTDELIQNKIHMITGNDFNELDGPLHPWVQRYRWEDTGWKGGDEGYPRFLYTMNGERKEYDVHTNDELWEALQPALQLVTRVLNSEHIHYSVMKDMRTRIIIPEEEDPRDPDDEENPIIAPFLTRYVPYQQIDLSETVDGIIELERMAYDWEANVNRLMDEHLVLDIGSCFWDWVDKKIGDNMTYGWTIRYGAGAEGTRYHVSIGAELLWPLLSDDISPTEKLNCSFLVASVILHEFAHAIQQALESLCTQRWAHPENQDPAITNAALTIGPDLWNPTVWNGEPPYMENSVAEVGNDTEQEIWGYLIGGLLGENAIKPTKEVQINTLVLRGTHWPGVHAPYETHSIQGRPYTMEDYSRPFPIDHTARLFKKEFWANSFMRYGHEALKQLPLDRVHKFVRTSLWLPNETRELFFGKEEAAFLKIVVQQLAYNGYPLLANYLRDTQAEVIQRKTLASRWAQDLLNWSRIFCNLDEAVTQLMASVGEGAVQTSIRQSRLSEQYKEYNLYVEDYNLRVQNGYAANGPVSFDVWRYNVEMSWIKSYKTGGTILCDVAMVYRLMLNDIGFMQTLVVDYLSLEPNIRYLIYKGGGANDQSVIGSAWGRIVGFLNHALALTHFFLSISTVPQLSDLKPHYERWNTRFKDISRMYIQLTEMLGGQDQYDPNDWRWKARLPMVPSSAWRKGADNLKLLAAQQYQRLDPRIRNTLDIAADIIETASGKPIFPSAADQDVLSGLVKELNVENQNRINDGLNLQQNPDPADPGAGPGVAPPLRRPSPGQPNAFWDSIAAAQQLGGASSGAAGVNPDVIATVAPAVIPSANNGITFGQASMLPRPLPQPPPPPQTTSRTPGPGEIPRRTSRSTLSPLAVAQGGVPRRGSIQPGLGFRNYGTWTTARRFDSISLEREGFRGRGSDAIQPQVQTAFPSGAQTRSQRGLFRPFVHPFADPTVVSADVQNYREKQAEQYEIQQQLYFMSPYDSVESYREMGVGMDVDESP